MNSTLLETHYYDSYNDVAYSIKESTILQSQQRLFQPLLKVKLAEGCKQKIS